MKLILRNIFYNIAVIYILGITIPGFHINKGAQHIIIAGVVLCLLNLVVKPVAKLLFFPINLLTLGLFSWIINVGIIYILLKFVPQIRISKWTFHGFYFRGFSIPEIIFTEFLTIILVSLLISIILSFLNWLSK